MELACASPDGTRLGACACDSRDRFMSEAERLDRCLRFVASRSTEAASRIVWSRASARAWYPASLSTAAAEEATSVVGEAGETLPSLLKLVFRAAAVLLLLLLAAAAGRGTNGTEEERMKG